MLRPINVHRSEGTAPLYRRPGKLRRWSVLLLGAGGMVAVACGGGDKKSDATQWIETDGAAGRINLDDVRDAYKDAYSDKGFEVSQFEQRVNEIYEGDNLVLIKVDRQGDQEVVVSGWEDLNGDKKLDESQDDKLFSITQELRDGGNYSTQGYGANGYYRESSPFSGFLPGLFLGYLLSGGRNTYITPFDRYDTIYSGRSSYRVGPSYSAQRSRNSGYGGSVSSRYGTGATSAPVSPARSSYQSRQVNSGGFKSSGSSRSIGGGIKSSSGSSGSKGSSGSSGGSSSSGGGLSGGGGWARM